MEIIWYVGFAHLVFDGILGTVALYYLAWQHVRRSYRPAKPPEDAAVLWGARSVTE